MKLVYCPSCGHVSLKSRVETDACEACGERARRVRVPYPWQSVAGSLVVLAGAVFLAWPQFDPTAPWAPAVDSLALRVGWLAVFLVAGFYFSRWGLREMKASAALLGKEQFPEDGA